MRYLAFHERMVRGTFDFPIELYYVDALHPRYEMPFHWHMECELILILEGGFSLSVDGEAVCAGPGDCVFVPSGAVHGGTPHNCVYECVVFDMDRFLQDRSVCRQKYAAVLGDSARIHTLLPAGGPAAQVVDALFENMEKEQPGYEFLTTGLLWQLIGIVLRHRLYAADSGEAPHPWRHADQMKSVLRRIRRDYAAPLTLDELAAEAGLARLEIAYGIPGCVGGGVYMNAGAYGGEMKDILENATFFDDQLREVTLSAADLHLGYRTSAFELMPWCILRASFLLEPGNADEIRERMRDFAQRRVDKQPLDMPSAGSTFKRPKGAYAGALIDKCGLRGYAVGGAAISEKHCGFVVNKGGATCADVICLTDTVAKIVKEQTGYTLEREIRVVR